MRSSLRKLIGVTTIATVVAMFGLAGVASAGIMVEPGEGAPADPGCTFNVFVQTANGLVDYSTFAAGLPEGTTNASIVASGSIGAGFAGAQASLLVGGATVAGPTTVNPVNGSFSFGPTNVVVPSDISISYTYGNQNAYGATCRGPGGVTVVRVRAAEAARTALAFTGSSDTTRNVLIGVAALMLGTVLVVGSRRRKHVNA